MYKTLFILALPCCGGQLTYTFDDPPPFTLGGNWVASGGNSGGYVSNTGTYNPLNFCAQPSANCAYTGGLANMSSSAPLLPQLFAPTDYGVTISFDYRTSATFSGVTGTVSSPVLIIMFSDPLFGPHSAMIRDRSIPLVTGSEWTHFEVPFSYAAFGGTLTPSDLPLLQRVLVGAEYMVHGSVAGAVTTTFDIDNLTFGHPVPEPSSVALAGAGLLLVAIRIRTT